MSIALSLVLVACSAASGQQLERVVAGLDRPVGVTNAGDGSGRLFVIQQPGVIRIVEDGQLVEEPFLDIRDRVDSGGERGLLGLAFSPEYEETGQFFVTYNDTHGATMVARFEVSSDPNLADPDSEQLLLRQSQPLPNHNGGHVAFGPDGYLYVGLGDGGGAGDPQEAGQDLGTWLGTILRLEVAPHRDDYEVPPDNPFVGTEGALPEIWAWGLRNPWRFSFDRETGDLWIGDVGQDRYEEVNLEPASSPGGVNYGWDLMEGPACFEPEDCEQEGLTLPVLSYDRESGWGRSVTGGYVYRGSALPDLIGTYIFGDYTSGMIFRADRSAGGAWSAEELLSTDLGIVSFGEDEAGELYVVDVFDGAIYRLAPGEPAGG